jgi:RNA polymerase sigma-70 factor (ECF subfamily)
MQKISAEQRQPPENADRDAAFARIVAEHARFLYRVAQSVLRHPQDAEDAVQDALLKLYRGESWRGMREERAFLARVVWRAAIDRRAARVSGVDEDGAELRVTDLRPTPERAAESGDERALLQELIDELPRNLREPLLLSAMEELSSREVGEVMGLPEGTVRTRLMRARNELKQMFHARRAAGREVAAGDRSSR